MATESSDSVFKNKFASELSKRLYLNTETADVFFKIKSHETGEIESIPGHKCFLIVANPVFEAMFCSNIKETGDIEMTDTSAEAFKEFLQFFYLNEVTLTTTNIIDVLGLAYKYCADECLQHCGDVLMKTMNIEDTCWVFEYAIFYRLKDLSALCKRNIRIHPLEIFKTDSFLNCDWLTLQRILKLGMLCTELDVFHACLEWSKATKARCEQNNLDAGSQKSLRSLLGELVFEVRYDLIPKEEFGRNLKYLLQVLNMDEAKEIWLLIGDPTASVSPKYTKSKARRIESFEWNKNDPMICDRRTYCNTRADPTCGSEIPHIQRTIFRCNQPMLWRGFFCGKLFSPYNFTLGAMLMEIVVTQHPDETFFPFEMPKMLCYSKKRLNHSDQWIAMPNSVFVKPHYKYKIEIKKLEKGSCFSNCCLAREKHLDSQHKIFFEGEITKDYSVTKLHFDRVV